MRWHENGSGQQADDDPPVSHHISHFLPPEEMAKFMQKQKVWIVETILHSVLPISRVLLILRNRIESKVVPIHWLLKLIMALQICSDQHFYDDDIAYNT